ncbi:MAG TPA: hypothetical protein VHP83_01810 [Aggregatilineaceae bacterium]|nr:hypothetical protein [Aggregatilineaceae bacterium]
MRRFILGVVGLVFLAMAAALAFASYWPQSKQERTTGGVLTTQAEAAALNTAPGLQPNLGVMVDGDLSGTNNIGEPHLSEEAMTDVASLDQHEIAAAPEMGFQPGATTNVVIGESTEVEVAPLDIQAAAAPIDGQGGVNASGVYEQRVVEMEWPEKFRVGGSGAVRITLKTLADGSLQPVAEIADNAVLATPIVLSDLYDTHTATVSAQLSAPDFDVDDLANPSQPLTRGGEVEWRWTLKAKDSGKQIMVLSINIVWTPKPGTGGTPLAMNIWGNSVQVESSYVFGGLTVPQASIFASVLGVIGFINQVPFLETILSRLLFGRRRRRTNNQRSSRSRSRR